MSGIKDPFEILADEITLIRRQVDHLQRTSLDKEEAEDFNTAIIEFLDKLAHVPKNLHQAMQRDLAQTALDVRAHAVEAAQSAAREGSDAGECRILR